MKISSTFVTPKPYIQSKLYNQSKTEKINPCHIRTGILFFVSLADIEAPHISFECCNLHHK